MGKHRTSYCAFVLFNYTQVFQCFSLFQYVHVVLLQECDSYNNVIVTTQGLAIVLHCINRISSEDYICSDQIMKPCNKGARNQSIEIDEDGENSIQTTGVFSPCNLVFVTMHSSKIRCITCITVYSQLNMYYCFI